MFKKIIYVCIVLVLLVELFELINKRDAALAKYWETQYELCGKVGYYHVGGGYCVESEK